MKVDHLKITEVLVLDKAEYKVREDGYIVANPRVGRIGIQLYSGKELGRSDMATVRVYRPESEVMDKLAMASIAHRPVTNDHPPEPVTADNWKKYSVGHTGDQVARDGEFIRVPMMLSDGGVIRDFNDGKKELSLGYTSRLEWRSGKTPQGEDFDAVQTMIRINHLAVVDAARGGPKLAIGDAVGDADIIDTEQVQSAVQLIKDGKVNRRDAFTPTEGAHRFISNGCVYRSALLSVKAQAVADQKPDVVKACDHLVTLIDSMETKKMELKTVQVMVDGVNVEMSDIAASVVQRRLKGLEQEAGDLRSKLAEQDEKNKKAEEKRAAAQAEEEKKIASKDAENAVLKQQLEDAKLTPAKLDQLVADRAIVAGKARTILGDALVLDGKTNLDMQKQVVDAKVSAENRKGWTDAQYEAAFNTLTADVKVDAGTGGGNAADAMRATFQGRPVITQDAMAREAPYQKYEKSLSDAWKTPTQ